MALAMTIEQREQFLADLHVGIISIPRKSKGPLAVPIWYDYSPGGELRVITNDTSNKGKLLKNASRISLCAQTEMAPYQYVSVEGPFSVRATADGETLSMAIRYLGEEQGRAYAANSPDSDDSITVCLKPETWFTVDYSKM